MAQNKNQKSFCAFCAFLRLLYKNVAIAFSK